jgi:hypothetical protein
VWLQEWVSAWRLAGPDKLGVRIVGRTTVRPFPTPCTSADYYIGQAVDVWWNDGWWEGIVVSKEPEGNVKVYFPGATLFVHLLLKYCQGGIFSRL